MLQLIQLITLQCAVKTELLKLISGCGLCQIGTRPCALRRVTVAPASYDLAEMAGRLWSLGACWA